MKMPEVGDDLIVEHVVIDGDWMQHGRMRRRAGNVCALAGPGYMHDLLRLPRCRRHDSVCYPKTVYRLSPKLFVLLHAQQSRMDSWDEYDAYDLSECSAEDFVHIDNTTIGAKTRHNSRTTAPEEVEAVAVTGGDWTRVDGTGGSGGLLQ